MRTSPQSSSKLTAMTLGIAVLFLLGSCSPKPQSFQDSALGTTILITIYGDLTTELRQGVMEILSDLEQRMTIWDSGPEGELKELNNKAGYAPYPLSPETQKVLDQALEVAERSGGALNPAIGPLVEAWGFITYSPKLPEPQTIQRLLPLTQWQDIQKTDEGMYLARPGMKVDLGALAKGFAADQVRNFLISKGVKSGIIDLGGNIVTLGTKPDGQLWRAGVQDPDQGRGAYLGVLSLDSRTLVTSGDYERFFMENGTRYHHILDPKTGYPANSDLRAVTIVTQSSLLADALSTACFVLGLEKSLELLKLYPGVEALFVLKDRSLYLTPDLRTSFELVANYSLRENVR